MGDNLPVIPPDFLVQMFITSREERLMGVNEKATSEWREAYGIPDTDEGEEMRESVDLKRERAESAASGRATKKMARKK
ncbi:hypothetical protein BD779DRAFT_1598238 [Infundibulicybe gibba]|nr:hypothetical protein BD779DRAFT_1601898 [Infundibulicybe gibba]KAF8868354.1 hypothetical protein BD779DRAFT_1598238 [Infundibulicybe gibba]